MGKRPALPWLKLWGETHYRRSLRKNRRAFALFMDLLIYCCAVNGQGHLEFDAEDLRAVAMTRIDAALKDLASLRSRGAVKFTGTPQEVQQNLETSSDLLRIQIANWPKYQGSGPQDVEGEEDGEDDMGVLIQKAQAVWPSVQEAFLAYDKEARTLGKKRLALMTDRLRAGAEPGDLVRAIHGRAYQYLGVRDYDWLRWHTPEVVFHVERFPGFLDRWHEAETKGLEPPFLPRTGPPPPPEPTEAELAERREIEAYQKRIREDPAFRAQEAEKARQIRKEAGV